jgi:hypothetical protein
MTDLIGYIKEFVMFGLAVIKNVYNFIMGLGFPMNVIAIVMILVAVFIIYQQSEHVVTSGVTRLMIGFIIVIAIAFGLIGFMFQG